MTPLPPLPIVDGVLRIDNSAMSNILRCPRYGWNSFVLKRVPARESDDLIFGKAIHAAQEWRYKTCGSREMTSEEKAAQEQVLEKAFEGIEIDETNWQNLGRAKESIAYWNEHFKSEPFDVLETERPVERHLGAITALKWCNSCKRILRSWEVIGEEEERKYCAESAQQILVDFQGRLDAIVRYERKPLVHDYKKMKWKDDERDAVRWQSSPQFRAYCWLASSLGYGEVRDYWIDSIVARKPLSRETKNSLPRNEFSREQYSITDSDIEEWKRDTLKHIETFLRYCADAPPPMNLNACSWPTKCAYWDCCSLKTEEQRSAWLNSGAYRDNLWSPMKKDETPS